MNNPRVRSAERAWRKTVDNVSKLDVKHVTRLLMMAEHELSHAKYECYRGNSRSVKVKKSHADVYERIKFIDNFITTILNGERNER